MNHFNDLNVVIYFKLQSYILIIFTVFSNTNDYEIIVMSNVNIVKRSIF